MNEFRDALASRIHFGSCAHVDADAILATPEMQAIKDALRVFGCEAAIRYTTGTGLDGLHDELCRVGLHASTVDWVMDGAQ